VARKPGQGGTGGSSGRGDRALRVKVKTAKGRRLSSTRWLERQLNDPYVARAKKDGYRGRAAYKLIEIDDRQRFLLPGARVVDLGCAPGGWCQVAVRRVNALGEDKGPQGSVLGIDLQEVEPIAGAQLHVLDFLEEGADDQVKTWLGGQADVVMSDMAAASSVTSRQITCGSWRSAKPRLSLPSTCWRPAGPSWRRSWPEGPRGSCKSC